jgi:WD40 repeat protein
MPGKTCLSIGVTLILSFIISASAFARYNPDWRWRTVRTDNFTIYYPEGHEEFARRVLSLTRQVHSDVAGYFGVAPRHVPIVLNPGTDIFSGFYSPFPNRISLFETPLYTIRGFGSATSDLIDLVFTHEYTHFVHITTSLGWYGALSEILGEGVALTNILAPGWMLEGISTNTETMFSDGGRGRSPEFKAQINSFNVGPGLWSLSAAGTEPPYSPPGGRIYLAGYHMVNYLNRTYGPDAFVRLSSWQARHPLRGAGGALKHVTGKSSSRFYGEFLSDFTARADSIKTVEKNDDLPGGKVILSEPLDTYVTHFWTERGTIMAPRGRYNEKITLVEADREGKILGEQAVGSVSVLGRVRPLPDGRLVLSEPFYHPLGEGELDTTDLVAYDPKTKIHHRLTHNAHTFSPSVSPDGAQITAVCRNGMWTDIIILDADGKNLRTLVTIPGVYWDNPSWSPDGKTIAAAFNSGGKNGIALIDAVNGQIRSLFTPDLNGYNDPSFSRDGRWIVFSSSRNGVWNIYALNPGEQKLYQLTAVPYGVEEPLISPDGKTLSFLYLLRGRNEINVLPFHPEEGRETSVDSGGSFNPALPASAEPAALPASRGIPVWEAYKPYIHTPFAGVDEKGASYGFLLLGGDPVGLNSYTAQVLYGSSSKRFGYDLGLTNRFFWPILNARLYDTTLESNFLNGKSSIWYGERGQELSFSLPVIHRTAPSVITGSYSAGIRTCLFSGLEGITVNKSHDRSTALFGIVSLSRMPDSATRDMVSAWGQSIGISHEQSFSQFGGELPGHNTVVVATQNFPSPVKHQGFSLTLAHQNQDGRIHYDNPGTIPRGYRSDESPGGFNLSNTLTAYLEYYFPLWYADRGLGLTLAHLHLLSGSLFADHGAGWNGGFTKSVWERNARTSLGATVRMKTTMVYILPIDIGVAAGYKPQEGRGFVQMFFGGVAAGLSGREKKNIARLPGRIAF